MNKKNQTTYHAKEKLIKMIKLKNKKKDAPLKYLLTYTMEDVFNYH